MPSAPFTQALPPHLCGHPLLVGPQPRPGQRRGPRTLLCPRAATRASVSGTLDARAPLLSHQATAGVMTVIMWLRCRWAGDLSLLTFMRRPVHLQKMMMINFPRVMGRLREKVPERKKYSGRSERLGPND